MATEVNVVLANGKCRRHLSPNHALFAAGNALHARAYDHYDGAALLQYEESDGDDDAQENDVFQCRLFTCDVGFRSVAAYEEHYDLMHRNVCLECYRPFLSLRLLDMHISETHDAFFKVLSKRQAMYKCLVDGCADTFWHDDKRNAHMVKTHQYPRGFVFSHTRRSQPATPQKSKKATKKKKSRQLRASDRDVVIDVVDQVAVTDDASCCASAANDDDHATAAATTCDTEMVDALAESVQALRIPKTVRFGRRQRGR